jgi:uncharacterized protein (TIRG00374 family)
MTGAAMRTLVRKSARWAVAGVLFFVILQHVDLGKILEITAKAKILYLALPCAFYPLNLLIGSMKLKWLLQGYRMPMKLGTAFFLNWTAGFFNNFLPSSVGGDFYRILCMNRTYPGRPAQVVSAVILDRGLGLLAMVILAGLTGVFFVDALISTTWTIVLIYVAAVVVTLGGLFVLFFGHNFRLSHTGKHAIINKIINGLNVLVSYPDKKALALSLLVSFLFLATTVGSNYFLFLAFNTDISLLVLLFVIPVVNLAWLIPISINGLGITEGIGIVLFSHFGFEPELVLSIMIAGRALLMLCSATGGIPFLLNRDPMPARSE